MTISVYVGWSMKEIRIACLGMGAWGMALANLLATKEKHKVICWTTDPELIRYVQEKHEHPSLPGLKISDKISMTTSLAEAIDSADYIVESVTSAGLRPVLERVRSLGRLEVPLILTSKGIEQDSGKTLPDVALDVVGSDCLNKIAVLSGPSFAQDVMRKYPTSVVASAYESDLIGEVVALFTTPFFRVYPNADIRGVAFGGALKNVIAIACGISDGLCLGASAKAALMTRGLHEIRKLSQAFGCKSETLFGLSGMGDLCLTCQSSMSRNFRFGVMLAEDLSPEEAQKRVGMVVEGAYTAVSAAQLSKRANVEMPITNVIYSILNEGLTPKKAVELLMQRAVKEEHL